MNSMNFIAKPLALNKRFSLFLLLTGIALFGYFMGDTVVNNRLLFVAILGGCACAVLFFHRMLLLYLTIALIPFQLFTMAFFESAYTWSVAQVLVKFLFLVTVFQIIQSCRFYFIHSPLNLWIVLFMFISVLSIVNAPDIREHIKVIIPEVIDLFLLYFIIANNVDTKRKLKTVIWIFLGAGFLVTTLGFIQFLQGPEGLINKYLESDIVKLFVGPGYAEMRVLGMLWDKPVTSIFVNHSDYAGFLLYVFPLAFGLFLMERKVKLKRLYGALTFLFGFNMVVSLARSGWLGITAVVLFGGILVLKRRLALVAKLVLVGIILIGIGLMISNDPLSILPSFVREHINTTTWQSTSSHSWQTRVAWWGEVIEDWSKHPILGTGISYEIHNQYVQILCMFGALGLAVLMIIIGLAIYKLIGAFFSSKENYVRGVALGTCAAFVGLLFHSMFWNDLFKVSANDMLFALFLGLATVLPRLNREDGGSGIIRYYSVQGTGAHKAIGVLLLITISVVIGLLITLAEFSPFDLFSYSAAIIILIFVLNGIFKKY